MFSADHMMIHVRKIICQAAGGVLGGITGAFVYFLFAFAYATVNNESMTHDSAWTSFIPDKQYLIPGVTISALIGFVAGICLARCLRQSDNEDTRRSRNQDQLATLGIPITSAVVDGIVV